jgi:two-component system, chemotaxis family, protein-glutamate methylesterase/glutaminase
LNDGAIGLAAIKKCGGITVIQDPRSAEFTDMPLYAHKTADPDYILPLEEMPALFKRILEDPVPPGKEIPPALRREVDIQKSIDRHLDNENDDLPLSCPSCGGPLDQIESKDAVQYRCRVGHSFNLDSLDESQSRQLEESLWIAFRVLDERRLLLKKMINDYERKGMNYLVQSTQAKINEVESHVGRLKTIMGIGE